MSIMAHKHSKTSVRFTVPFVHSCDALGGLMGGCVDEGWGGGRGRQEFDNRNRPGKILGPRT